MERDKLNSKEVKELLVHIVKNNIVLAESGELPVSFEITGDPGLGKTSLINQVSEEFGFKCVKLNLSQFDDLGDLVGVPFKEFELINAKTGTRKWVPEPSIPVFIGNGYDLCNSVPRTSFAPPLWIANEENPIILILDDWTRADERFLQAVMELIMTHKYGSWKLPSGSTIVLTSNPDNGENKVNTIDDAMMTRFIGVELVWDANCWAAWAEKNNIKDRYINFLLGNQELVTSSVNPRAFVNFFHSIYTIDSFEDDANNRLVTRLGNASIGEYATNMFKQFIKNKLDYIPTVDEMLSMDFDLLTKVLKTCANSNSTYHPEVASIVATRIVNRLIDMYDMNKLNDSAISRVSDILAIDIFTPDIISYVANTLISKDITAFASIVNNSVVAHELMM